MSLEIYKLNKEKDFIRWGRTVYGSLLDLLKPAGSDIREIKMEGAVPEKYKNYIKKYRFTDEENKERFVLEYEIPGSEREMYHWQFYNDFDMEWGYQYILQCCIWRNVEIEVEWMKDWKFPAFEEGETKKHPELVPVQAMGTVSYNFWEMLAPAGIGVEDGYPEGEESDEYELFTYVDSDGRTRYVVELEIENGTLDYLHWQFYEEPYDAQIMQFLKSQKLGEKLPAWIERKKKWDVMQPEDWTPEWEKAAG